MKNLKLLVVIMVISTNLIGCVTTKSVYDRGESETENLKIIECFPIDSLDITSWDSVDSIVIGSAIFDVVLHGDSSVIKFNDWIVEEPTGLVEPNEKGYETVMSVKKYFDSIDSKIERVLDRPHRQFLRRLIKDDGSTYYVDPSLYEDTLIIYHTRLENVLTEKLTAQERDSVKDMLVYIIESKDNIIDSISTVHHGWIYDFIYDDEWYMMFYKQPEPMYVYQCSIFVDNKCYVTKQWPYYKERYHEINNLMNNFTPAFERLRLLLNRIRNKYAPEEYLKFDPDKLVNFEIN